MTYILIVILIILICTMIFSGIKLLNINLKMKQLLYQKGENPNPNELEVPLKLYGIHNFWEFFEDKRKRKKFRQELSPKLERQNTIYGFILGLALIFSVLILNLLLTKAK